MAMRTALHRGGVGVVVVPGKLSLPPKITYGQVKGFTLHTSRTILSGNVDELVDLAKTSRHEVGVE
jgi:pyruvate dehydrogenase (quinone)